MAGTFLPLFKYGVCSCFFCCVLLLLGLFAVSWFGLEGLGCLALFLCFWCFACKVWGEEVGPSPSPSPFCLLPFFEGGLASQVEVVAQRATSPHITLPRF